MTARDMVSWQTESRQAASRQTEFTADAAWEMVAWKTTWTDGTIRRPMLRRPLIKNHRGRARATLYLVPLVFLGLVWGIRLLAGRFEPDQGWHGVDLTGHEAVQLFREYLTYDTSYPDGNEIPGAEFLARQLEAAGIPTHLERLGSRNANLWAILEGADPQALVLHNHIDVEPAREPERWRHPPFSGAYEAPFIYGRGAFDMKNVAIAQLLSMLELKRSGEPLQRSLIFLATGDEERFSRLGTLRLIRQHPELVARFYAVLTEGGAVEATDLSQVKYWGTEFGQKRFIDIWVCDTSRDRLLALRQELLMRQAPPRPPAADIVRFLKGYSVTRTNPRFRRLLGQLETESANVAHLPPYYKAMTRNEIVAFPVEEDPEGGYVMRLILHLLPDIELDEGWDELLSDVLFGFSYTVEVPHEPVAGSPLDHPVFQTIHEFMGEILPEVTHGPLFLPWVATDARFFRQQGIPSYGYSPFWILSSDTLKMKGRNERMAATPLVEGVERYQQLVRRLVLPSP